MIFSTSNIVLEPPRVREQVSLGNVLNAKDAFGWLHENSGFIGWTYTINPKVWSLLQPAKLIVGCPANLAESNGKVYNSRIRVASCCHAKCYIADDEMLIGSLNLVAPTLEDLCYRVTNKKEVAHMKKMFAKAWAQLK